MERVEGLERLERLEGLKRLEGRERAEGPERLAVFRAANCTEKNRLGCGPLYLRNPVNFPPTVVDLGLTSR